MATKKEIRAEIRQLEENIEDLESDLSDFQDAEGDAEYRLEKARQDREDCEEEISTIRERIEQLKGEL